jgi:hypothetical protein
MPTQTTPKATAKTPTKSKKADKALKDASNELSFICDQTYGHLQLVTSMSLKRRLVNNPYYAKFFIPDTAYTWLNTLGISAGVTWDEVLRGLIEQHMASGEQLAGLKNFIPALN